MNASPPALLAPRRARLFADDAFLFSFDDDSGKGPVASGSGGTGKLDLSADADGVVTTTSESIVLPGVTVDGEKAGGASGGVALAKGSATSSAGERKKNAAPVNWCLPPMFSAEDAHAAWDAYAHIGVDKFFTMASHADIGAFHKRTVEALRAKLSARMEAETESAAAGASERRYTSQRRRGGESSDVDDAATNSSSSLPSSSSSSSSGHDDPATRGRGGRKVSDYRRTHYRNRRPRFRGGSGASRNGATPAGGLAADVPVEAS